MRYVIIGNSTASVGTIDGIRQIDKEGEIIVLSKEAYACYSRPLISYLLWGKTDMERMRYRTDDYFVENKVEVKLNAEVVAIDNKKKSVKLADGSAIKYDKLMYATGSRPFVPPMKGLDKVESKHTFYTLEDALALQASLTKDSKVLIVGAGLIGLKCCEGILSSVAKVTVVDLAPNILSSILDKDTAEYVAEHLTNQGVDLIMGDSVAEFSAKSAKLNSGKVVDFDVVVLAIGVRANTELMTAIGAEANRGLTINNKMETSIADIYAAGDCTESYDITADMTRVLALLPNAYFQGEVAGQNMAGSEAEHNTAIPMNAMGLLGLHMTTAGSYIGDTYVSRENGYKKLFYKDDLLKGFIIIGDVSKTGIYTTMIREKIALSSLDFETVAEKPGLIAFTRKDRDAMLKAVQR